MAAPPIQPDHWLYRLSVEHWLAAAATELGHCEQALGRRAVRPGVTHARRAAGMAWNAVLVIAFDERYGRSYMEHVAALAQDDSVPAAVKAAAARLRDTPSSPPALIQLGKPDLSVLHAARSIIDYARARTSPDQSRPMG
jgi:hypothetical protein